jgi:hypothetical protein
MNLPSVSDLVGEDGVCCLPVLGLTLIWIDALWVVFTWIRRPGLGGGAVTHTGTADVTS